MNNLILKLLNKKFKTHYQSISRLVVNYPEAISYVPNPTLEEFLSFFKNSGTQTREVALEEGIVVKTALKAIRKFPEVKENTDFLNTVIFYPEIINQINIQEKFMADAMFIRAISRKRIIDPQNNLPFLITAIENPTYRMRFFSARMEPASIEFIQNKKEKIINEALRNDPTVIRFVDEPTFDQKRLAIGQDIRTLGLIKNQDRADAKIALSLNPAAFRYIKPENRDVNMTEEALVDGDNSMLWLTIENFTTYNFSLEEINLMIKKGSDRLLSLLCLLILNKKLDLTAEMEAEIKKRLSLNTEEEN